MSSASLALFTKLSDDVLEDLFMACTYQEGQFSDEIEGDIYANGSPTARRYGTLARAIMRCSKRFYVIAIRVLWRSVVIRSAGDLELVTEQASAGTKFFPQSLASFTRRLEVRSEGVLDLRLVGDLMKDMDELEVVVIRDHSRGHYNGPFDSEHELVESLYSHTHRLRRLQFESDFNVPSCALVLNILHANCQLHTLRVAQMTHADAEEKELCISTSHFNTHSLSTLSLGVPITVAHVDGKNAIDAFLRTVNMSVSSLPMLQHVELFNITPAFFPFMSAHGTQVRTLLYAALPKVEAEDDYKRTWIDNCPNLEQLHWLITDAYSERPPDSHASLRKLKVEYVKTVLENQWKTLNQLEDTLDVFRSGAYPHIAEIEVVMRGQGVPAIDSFEWIGTDEEVSNAVVGDDETGWSVTVRF